MQAYLIYQSNQNASTNFGNFLKSKKNKHCGLNCGCVTEKLFACKRFCHYVFQILLYFLCKNCTPVPHPTPPRTLPPTPLKKKVLPSPPSLRFSKIWQEDQPHPSGKGGMGAHYVLGTYQIQFT